jgi:hypothetical protein
MIRGLTLWLIRRTCLGCGKATARTNWHTACERSFCGADS